MRGHPGHEEIQAPLNRDDARLSSVNLAVIVSDDAAAGQDVPALKRATTNLNLSIVKVEGFSKEHARRMAAMTIPTRAQGPSLAWH